MSFFFIFRLHFVFKSSAMKINKFILIALVILTIISTCLGCVSAITGPFKMWNYSGAVSDEINPNFYISWPALLIIIIVDLAVMIYYVHRLFTVVVLQGEVSYVSSKSSTNKGRSEMVRLSSDKDGRNANVSEVSAGDQTGDEYEHEVEAEEDNEDTLEVHVHVDEKIVKTITKSTLLSLIGISTSLWLNIEYLVMASQTKTDGVLIRAVGNLDGAINAISMYLVFSFAKAYYNVGCRLCHNGMSKCCVCVTKRAVLKAKDNTAEI